VAIAFLKFALLVKFVWMVIVWMSAIVTIHNVLVAEHVYRIIAALVIVWIAKEAVVHRMTAAKDVYVLTVNALQILVVVCV
jgi:hypothetical protein